ncbi:hydrolase [Flavobacterium gilvum]|uniref:Hydrolase n=2 Tax=Flavobacterium gilvum TaxID=1492737 RepID=A0AAC9N7W8_9FLAO|nr:hydrolase [Flavobacterium gilvum]
MIIDVHHHVIGKNNPNFANLPKWDMQIDAEESERLGIGGALLSLPVSSTPEQTRAINNFLAGYASYDNKRYGILTCLPSANVEATLKEIEYSYDSLHADGFCMPSHVGGMYIGDDRMDEILAELNRRNAVVLLHPVKPGGDVPTLSVTDPSVWEFPFDTTRAIMDLLYRGKLKKYSNIKWIVSHAGGVLPYLAYRFSTVAEECKAINLSKEEILDSFKNLYYDLALSTSDTVFQTLKDMAGTSQIVFGTDAPLRPKTGTQDSVAIFKNTSIFTTEEKQNIAYNNSARLFPRFTKN